jgi:hypothetical protein
VPGVSPYCSAERRLSLSRLAKESARLSTRVKALYGQHREKRGCSMAKIATETIVGTSTTL